MMNEINIGSLQMPLNAATKTFAILAKRGAGKTYTGCVIAEEFHANNIPFVVFDPIDVWWGLRFAADGKSKGLPVVVFGLEHADVKIDKDMGREIARAIVRDNISCIISTFGMPKSQQRHLIAEFADELLNINNMPRHIFIEEAHEFVPQRIMGDLGKCFNAVSNLVVMGRNRGIGVTLINQRASTINKDVLTQLDTLLAFRLVAPQDRDALKDWVEFHSAEGDFNEFIKSLPSLETGEGWIWSPEFMNIFQRIKIRKRKTFHPDREKLDSMFEMPVLNQGDVQAFIERFQNTLVSKKVEQKAGKQKAVTVMLPQKEEKKDDTALIALRNEYESKLLQKDVEIRKLQAIIDGIKKSLGVESDGTVTPMPSSNLSMWLEKLGNTLAQRVLKFCSQNQGSFTREQLALATGTTYDNVRKNAIPILKRNRLLIEENGRLKVNPDL